MSDIVGVSGRAILNALIAGEMDPNRLADLTRGRLKAPRADLVDARHGRVTDHHRFMIKLHLTQIDALETAVTTIERTLETRSAPFVPPSPPDDHARAERDDGPRPHR